MLATFSKKAGTELNSAVFPILMHRLMSRLWPEPLITTLLRNRVFADVIINRKMRSYWIRMSPKFKDYCPQKKRTHREKTTV